MRRGFAYKMHYYRGGNVSVIVLINEVLSIIETCFGRLKIGGNIC